VWRADDLEAVFARYVASSGFARAIATLERGKLNTDDMTRVEFGFARGLGFRTHQFEVSELRDAASEHGFGAPRLVDGTLDRALMDERAIAMMAADWHAPPTPPDDAPAGLKQRTTAVQKWEDGDLAEAAAAWRAQTREPDDSIALAAVAESLADDGDVAAEKYIARLRPAHAVEADFYEARLSWRRGDAAAATATLVRGFAAAERDPWPLQMVLRRALELAREMASHDRAAAAALWRALERPFAVHLQNDYRLRTRAQIAWVLDWPRLCTEALAPMEPAVPFDSELLLRRVRCYEATHDRRLPAARRDLAELIAHAPMDFAAGLPPAK